MIIALAGLPGVGKTTLAHALATRLDAVVLDKDRIRASLFPSSHVDYTVEQDDFCVDVMYRTAGWLLHRDPATVVILDGRTYARAEHVTALKQAAASLGATLRIVECTCEDAVALARLDADRSTGRHPAADRDASLYRDFRATADPIGEPKLVVDTGRPLADCVDECLAHLAGEVSGE